MADSDRPVPFRCDDQKTYPSYQRSTTATTYCFGKFNGLTKDVGPMINDSAYLFADISDLIVCAYYGSNY